ncbi:conserved protein of unknown function (plasmid) [Pararobbsia alpina]
MRRIESLIRRMPLVRLCAVRGASQPARFSWAEVRGGPATESGVPCFSVAVVATGADRLATFPLVVRVIGPLYFAVFAHDAHRPQSSCTPLMHRRHVFGK